LTVSEGRPTVPTGSWGRPRGPSAAGMGSTSVTALDGGVVELRSASLDVAQPGATTVAVFDMEEHQQEFCGGAPGFGDFVARAHGIDLSEEYSLYNGARGRLRIGSKVEIDPQSGYQERVCLGVWQGRRASLKTTLYQGSSSDLIALFNEYTIEEAANGVVIEPKDPRISLVRDAGLAPRVVQHVPALGHVDVFELTARQSRQVPRWNGRSVDGGELFLERPEHPAPTLLLVGETALTRIYVDDRISEDRLIKTASTLEATWRRGG
jgi:hypothetical protein